MSDWRATHVVSEGGASVWSQPDPAVSPIAELAAGTDVVLSERREGWTEVVCANGFRGWVDGNRLVPVSAPAVPPGPPPGPPPAAGGSPNRTPFVVAALVVAALVAAAFFLLRSDDKEKAAVSSVDTSTEDTSSSRSDFVANDVVKLNVPSGWSVSDDGLEAAENESDLGSAVPKGPRVKATVGAPRDDVLDLFSTALDQGDGDFTGDASETDVSGTSAVQVEFSIDGITQRLIIVHPAGGEPVSFVLEAPSQDFDSAVGEMAAVPGLR